MQLLLDYNYFKASIQADKDFGSFSKIMNDFKVKRIR